MSDHDFEKQVRQKLDDLRLTPTEQSWEKIEQGIGNKKRRRVPLLWLPVLLAGLVAGGYFLVSQFTSPNNGTVVSAKENTKEAPLPESATNAPSSLPNPGALKENFAEQAETQNKETESGSTNRTELRTRSNQAPNTSSGVNTQSEETLLMSDANPLSSGATPSNEKSMAEAPAESGLTTRVSSMQPDFRQSIGDVANLLNREFVPFSNFSIPKAPAPPILQKRKLWSYGVTAFGGVSGLSNGHLFNLKQAMTADMPRPVNAAFAPSYTPYRIVADVSFSAGLVVKREISKRFQISAGLSYLQISSRYKVGNQTYGSQAVNAAPLGQYVRNYFTVEQHQPRDYRNVYEYAEIPVLVHTRINQSKKLPLYWNAGGSYAHLLRSNSKQFDGSTGVYYTNEKLVNKSQVSVITGIDAVLFSRSQRPLWVGPMARYSLTRQINSDAGDQKNYLSAGINFKWYLK